MSARTENLEKARAEMIAARERVMAAVRGKSRDELLAPAADGGWSAAEVLDHLRTGEGKLVRALEKLERREKLRMPWYTWYYRIPMRIAFTNIKLKAPGPVRPRTRAEIDPDEVIAAMTESRKALLAFADRLGPERWSRFVFPHFIIGRFDGVDWFRFLTLHETRHAGQIERLFGQGIADS